MSRQRNTIRTCLRPPTIVGVFFIAWVLPRRLRHCKREDAMEIAPGKNIAIKVPLHKWEDTIAFYRD